MSDPFDDDPFGLRDVSSDDDDDDLLSDTDTDHPPHSHTLNSDSTSPPHPSAPSSTATPQRTLGKNALNNSQTLPPPPFDFPSHIPNSGSIGLTSSGGDGSIDSSSLLVPSRDDSESHGTERGMLSWLQNRLAAGSKDSDSTSPPHPSHDIIRPPSQVNSPTKPASSRVKNNQAAINNHAAALSTPNNHTFLSVSSANASAAGSISPTNSSTGSDVIKPPSRRASPSRSQSGSSSSNGGNIQSPNSTSSSKRGTGDKPINVQSSSSSAQYSQLPISPASVTTTLISPSRSSESKKDEGGDLSRSTSGAAVLPSAFPFNTSTNPVAPQPQRTSNTASTPSSASSTFASFFSRNNRGGGGVASDAFKALTDDDEGSGALFVARELNFENSNAATGANREEAARDLAATGGGRTPTSVAHVSKKGPESHSVSLTAASGAAAGTGLEVITIGADDNAAAPDDDEEATNSPNLEDRFEKLTVSFRRLATPDQLAAAATLDTLDLFMPGSTRARRQSSFGLSATCTPEIFLVMLEELRTELETQSPINSRRGSTAPPPTTSTAQFPSGSPRGSFTNAQTSTVPIIQIQVDSPKLAWLKLGGWELILKIFERFCPLPVVGTTTISPGSPTSPTLGFDSALLDPSLLFAIQSCLVDLLRLLWKDKLKFDEKAKESGADILGVNRNDANQHTNIVERVFELLQMDGVGKTELGRRRSLTQLQNSFSSGSSSNASLTSSAAGSLNNSSKSNATSTQQPIVAAGLMTLHQSCYTFLSMLLASIRGVQRHTLLSLCASTLRYFVLPDISRSKLLLKSILSVLMRVLQQESSVSALHFQAGHSVSEILETQTIPMVHQAFRNLTQSRFNSNEDSTSVQPQQIPSWSNPTSATPSSSRRSSHVTSPLASPTSPTSPNSPTAAAAVSNDFLYVLFCLFFSKTILLDIGVSKLIEDYELVDMITTVMKKDFNRANTEWQLYARSNPASKDKQRGSFSQSQSPTNALTSSIHTKLMSSGSHCLAFLLASQTPSLRASQHSQPSWLREVQLQFQQHRVVELMVGIMDYSLAVCKRAQQISAASGGLASPATPAGSPTSPNPTAVSMSTMVQLHGGMIADIAFSLFIIMGSPLNIAINQGKPNATKDTSAAKGKIHDLSGFADAAPTSPQAFIRTPSEISASVVTPLSLLSISSAPSTTSNAPANPTSFVVDTMLDLFIVHKNNGNAQICLSTLMSLILHYPTVAAHLLEEGFLQQLHVRLRDEILQKNVVETFCSVWIELFDALGGIDLAISIVGGQLAPQLLETLARAKVVYEKSSASANYTMIVNQLTTLQTAVTRLREQHVHREKIEAELQKKAKRSNYIVDLFKRKSLTSGLEDEDRELTSGMATNEQPHLLDFDIDDPANEVTSFTSGAGEDEWASNFDVSSSSSAATVFGRKPSLTSSSATNVSSSTPLKTVGRGSGVGSGLSVNPNAHSQTAAYPVSSPREVPQLKFAVDIGAMKTIHNMAVEQLLTKLGL